MEKKVRSIKVDGVNAFIFDWEKRRISGWCYGLKVGDRVLADMQSGKTAVFEIEKLDYTSDPKDQYFATVKDIGYLQDLQNTVQKV